MAGASLSTVHGSATRCVLLVVEDASLAELLAEAILEAGHIVQLALPGEVLDGGTRCDLFQAAIVDLDTWDRQGMRVIEHLRHHAPTMTVIALLPCGARASDFVGAHYHLSLEKPARMHAVLSAVGAAALQPPRS